MRWYLYFKWWNKWDNIEKCYCCILGYLSQWIPRFFIWWLPWSTGPMTTAPYQGFNSIYCIGCQSFYKFSQLFFGSLAPRGTTVISSQNQTWTRNLPGCLYQNNNTQVGGQKPALVFVLFLFCFFCPDCKSFGKGQTVVCLVSVNHLHSRLRWCLQVLK